MPKELLPLTPLSVSIPNDLQFDKRIFLEPHIVECNHQGAPPPPNDKAITTTKQQLWESITIVCIFLCRIARLWHSIESSGYSWSLGGFGAIDVDESIYF